MRALSKSNVKFTVSKANRKRRSVPHLAVCDDFVELLMRLLHLLRE